MEARKEYSRRHPREGYRKAYAKAAFPAGLGPINHKRIERLWRMNGLAVLRKKLKRRRGKHRVRGRWCRGIRAMYGSGR